MANLNVQESHGLEGELLDALLEQADEETGPTEADIRTAVGEIICKHPPDRLYSWVVPNSPVVDDQGNWVPDDGGNPTLTNILCCCCLECGAVLSGAAKQVVIYDVTCPECGHGLEVDSVRLYNMSGVPITPTGDYDFNQASASYESGMEGVICPNCEYTADEPEMLPG